MVLSPLEELLNSPPDYPNGIQVQSGKKPNVFFHVNSAQSIMNFVDLDLYASDTHSVPFTCIVENTQEIGQKLRRDGRGG